MAGEAIRLKRDQLEKFIDDYETLRQFEQLFEVLDTINSTTVVGLRVDVDANTVRSTTNSSSIITLQTDKADIDSPSFTTDIDVQGPITVTGTVDGRDVAADGSKLDTIESGATGDQTAGEIKSLYESNVDTNAFTDADEGKLDGIETLADVTDQSNVTSSLGATNSPAVTDTGTVGNAGALIKLDAGGNLDGRDIAVDGSKLDGIEAGATGDQTAGEIKTLYESNADTNAFTDADESKLDGIEALADVTDQSNVTSALGSVDSPALNTSAGAGDAGKLIKLDADGQIDATMINDADINLDNVTEGATNKFFTASEETKLAGIETGAQVNTVDSVAGKTGVVTLVKGDVGLGNVDNTSDADKPVSTATQTALDAKFDDFTKNSQTPTTGFSITLTQDGTNQWLILNPSTSLASGTITLIAPGSATDLQEVLISTTKQITSITIAGNGATAVHGAPLVLAAGSTYRLKYDSALTSWFTI